MLLDAGLRQLDPGALPEGGPPPGVRLEEAGVAGLEGRFDPSPRRLPRALAPAPEGHRHREERRSACALPARAHHVGEALRRLLLEPAQALRLAGRGRRVAELRHGLRRSQPYALERRARRGGRRPRARARRPRSRRPAARRRPRDERRPRRWPGAARTTRRACRLRPPARACPPGAWSAAPRSRSSSRRRRRTRPCGRPATSSCIVRQLKRERTSVKRRDGRSSHRSPRSSESRSVSPSPQRSTPIAPLPRGMASSQVAMGAFRRRSRSAGGSRPGAASTRAPEGRDHEMARRTARGRRMGRYGMPPPARRASEGSASTRGAADGNERHAGSPCRTRGLRLRRCVGRSRVWRHGGGSTG